MTPKTEELKIALKYWLEGNGYLDALRAMHFAIKLHNGLRKDGTTREYHHQLCIVGYLKTIRASLSHVEDVVIAGFLHDSVEDYPHQATWEKFKQIFPDQTKAEQCFELSQRLNKQGKEKEEYFSELASCPIASIVKAADRIHNFQTMQGVFSPEKQIKYINECEEWILPMLREARSNFPEQNDAYFNASHMLHTQIELLKAINANRGNHDQS